MIIIIAIAAFISTLLGGLLALRLKDKLHLVLGFSAGAVIAVAFFDLIPESIELGASYYSVNTIMTITAIGFLFYLLLDRLIFSKNHEHDQHECEECRHEDLSPDEEKMHKGTLGATSLCLHSLMDGIAIGLSFQVSSAVGIIVAVAVLTHDFSDGINTVGMIMRHAKIATKKIAFRWLLLDAVAPVIGIVSTMFFSISEKGLSAVVALFAGFFLYIGASDLIPESHHAHPKFMTTLMTLFGAVVLYVAIMIAG